MPEPLKPCPFCGTPAVVETRPGWVQVGCWALECDVAPATHAATMDRAVEAWNTRAAPREPGEACPDCGYDVLVTDPDLRDPVEARVHAIDCPRTRYVVEYGVEAPPTVRHVRPHRSGCGHYDCAAPRPDAGDGTGEPTDV